MWDQLRERDSAQWTQTAVCLLSRDSAPGTGAEGGNGVKQDPDVIGEGLTP